MNRDRLQERVKDSLPILSVTEVEELTGVLERLIAALRPMRVYVFGSYARTEMTPDSDIYLLMVVPDTESPSYRLTQAAYRAAVPYTCSLDIVVMSRAEFERRGRAAASLPAAVLREGLVLYAA